MPRRAGGAATRRGSPPDKQHVAPPRFISLTGQLNAVFHHGAIPRSGDRRRGAILYVSAEAETADV
jgi:hypothetical protein